MQIRKLNIMDGNESELRIFSKFLYDSLEHREQGLSGRVNGQAMAAAIQNGALVALVAEEDGKAIGMQLWEIVTFGLWYDTAVRGKNLRFQYMSEGVDLEISAGKQVAFLHHGIASMQEDKWTLFASVDVRDQISNIAQNCGLSRTLSAYSLN